MRIAIGTVIALIGAGLAFTGLWSATKMPSILGLLTAEFIGLAGLALVGIGIAIAAS